MINATLLRIGGFSAFAFVVLFSISILSYWVTGGLEFRAWVPLFSSLVCFWFVASIAAYEFLSKTEYALARIGWGFAILSVIILLLEAVVWGADRMVFGAQAVGDQEGLTELRALFNSLHVLVLWTIGIWYALWGSAFLRIGGKAKFIGITMLVVAICHAVDYALLRLGVSGLFIEIWHLVGSQGFNLITYFLVGLFLLKEAEAAES